MRCRSKAPLEAPRLASRQESVHRQFCHTNFRSCFSHKRCQLLQTGLFGEDINWTPSLQALVSHVEPFRELLDVMKVLKNTRSQYGNLVRQTLLQCHPMSPDCSRKHITQDQSETAIEDDG